MFRRTCFSFDYRGSNSMSAYFVQDMLLEDIVDLLSNFMHIVKIRRLSKRMFRWVGIQAHICAHFMLKIDLVDESAHCVQWLPLVLLYL